MATTVNMMDEAMATLYNETDLQALHQQAESMNCAPYNTPPTKHAKAVAAVLAGRVHAVDDPVHPWQVAGEKDTPTKRILYRVDKTGCSCPYSQTHQELGRWACYHSVSAELYDRWQQALQPGLFPKEPTVEERLAASRPHPLQDAPGATRSPQEPQDVPEVIVSPEPALEAPRALSGQTPVLQVPPRPASPFRSITAIIADLGRPLPDACVSTKTVKGTMIRYLHWQTVVRVLDAYAPGWTNDITRLEQQGDIVRVTIRLSIPCAEGVVFREATGEDDEWGEEEENRYGNPSANAQANALKRAAALLGVGQWLYDKAGDPSAAALVDHLKAQRREALAALGTVLLDAGMTKEAASTWIKQAAAVSRVDETPLSTAKLLLAQVQG